MLYRIFVLRENTGDSFYVKGRFDSTTDVLTAITVLIASKLTVGWWEEGVGWMFIHLRRDVTREVVPSRAHS